MKGDASPFELEPGLEAGRPGESGRSVSGILCLHGFTGTPFEMRYLAERLAERPDAPGAPSRSAGASRSSYRVVGVRLPGHGTSPEDLDRTAWSDWYGAAEEAFDRLAAQHEQVAVVGQSLGGLLALHLAGQRAGRVAAVASLAAPLWLPRLARGILRVTRPGSPGSRLVPRLPKLGGSDVRDQAMKRANPSYRTIPVPALHQFVAFMEMVRAEVPRIAAPTLIVHARKDHTAPFASSEELVARLPGRPVEHHVLEHSYHLIAFDVERDRVAALVGDFFDRMFDRRRKEPS